MCLKIDTTIKTYKYYKKNLDKAVIVLLKYQNPKN